MRIRHIASMLALVFVLVYCSAMSRAANASPPLGQQPDGCECFPFHGTAFISYDDCLEQVRVYSVWLDFGDCCTDLPCAWYYHFYANEYEDCGGEVYEDDGFEVLNCGSWSNWEWSYYGHGVAGLYFICANCELYPVEGVGYDVDVEITLR